MKVCMFLLFPVLPASCATGDTFKTDSFDGKDSFSVISVDSNLRSIFIKKRKGPLVFCSEPFPDSSESSEEGVSEKTSTGNVSGGVALENGMTSASLGGRSSTVLIVREILFRTCELGANFDTTFEQQSRLFTGALESIQSIVGSEQSKTAGTKAINSSAILKEGPRVDVGDKFEQSSSKSTTTDNTANTDDSDSSN